MKILRRKKHIFNEMAPWNAAKLFFSKYKTTYKNIGAYWPINFELDTRPIIKVLLENKITIFLPCINEDKLNFFKWDNKKKLVFNKLKFYEPVFSSSIGEPDLIIVPLLAFDSLGYRLGYGKGYYDRYYSLNKNKKYVGFCYSFQYVKKLPSESHDLKFNTVITDTETKSFNSK